ncbi:hypothetical protein UB46_23495 [Burkholderiaceae bacterium 16]|nr:hypothetical protein UB46_23495 [Burkholderiaceae bacterium 16]
MTKEKFFDKELADKVGVGKALHVAVLTQEIRECIERINVERAKLGLVTIQEVWEAGLFGDEDLPDVPIE